jgi:nucleotide-binding universal stress UspA family protein
MFSTVLVMLALDERDDSLLEAVVASAESFAIRKLVVVHVHNADPVAGPVADLVQSTSPERPAVLDAAEARLRDALSGVEIVVDNPTGPPEAVLNRLTEEHDVDLVVMGRHSAENGKAGWGSASRKILRLTTCSAMVVPRGSTLDLSRVVLGFDFSKYAAMALGVACRVAGSVDAVYQYDLAPSRAGLTRDEFNKQILTRAQTYLRTELLPALDTEVEPTVVVKDGGHVADALISAAGTAPIVMGSRGLSPLARLLIGSSADRVAGRSRGPVLIVRKKGSTLNIFDRLFHRV